ncbi:MAG: hypothetical protein U0325_29825 [Polyangiales bacterium]
MRRLLGFVLLIVAGACGEAPKPLTGQARWVDTCLREGMGRSGGPHVITGTDSSAGRAISCAIGMIGSDIQVKLLAVVGDNFDSSNEALFLEADFPGVGASASVGSRLGIRGVGWGVSPAARVGSNSMYACEVVLTRADLATRSFSGRFKCRDVRDDSTVPPRVCQILGQNNITAEADWADFTFSNCSAL